MKVFLDTNLLLDWLLDRQDTFADEATTLMEAYLVPYFTFPRRCMASRQVVRMIPSFSM